MVACWFARQALCVLAVMVVTPPVALAADTAAAMHKDLQAVGDKTREVFQFVDTLKVESVVGQAQKVVDGIDDITALLKTATSHLKGQGQVAAGDAPNYSEELMNTVLSPIRSVLMGMQVQRYPISQDTSCKALKLIDAAVRSLGNALDEYESALAVVMPTEAARVALVKDTLDNSVRDFLANWHPEIQPAAAN